jgi:hypothetical protein
MGNGKIAIARERRLNGNDDPVTIGPIMSVIDLPSPYETVGGIVYFRRMLEKIRRNLDGKLPEEYQPNLGAGFDGRCVNFLRVEYPDVVAQVKHGQRDEEVLEWCFGAGRQPSEEDIEVWNEFMMKRGWRDDSTPTLRRRIAEGQLEDRNIQTFFDYIDIDEGREPGSARLFPA